MIFIFILICFIIQCVICQIACTGDAQECVQFCAATGDKPKFCTGSKMDRNSPCISKAVCFCDDLTNECDSKCGTKKQLKCLCVNGTPEIVCEGDNQSAESDGLSGGAVAGIVIAVLIGCGLCVVGLFFVWRMLPDAEEEEGSFYDNNSKNNSNTERNDSSNRTRDPKYDMPADPSPTTSNNNTYNNNNNTDNTNDTKDDYLDTPEHSTPTTAFGSRTTFEVDSMLNNDAPTNDSPYSREPAAAAPTYGQTPVNPQYQQTPSSPRKLSVTQYQESPKQNDDPAAMAFMSLDDLQGNADQFYGKLPTRPQQTTNPAYGQTPHNPNNNNNNNSSNNSEAVRRPSSNNMALADKRRAAAEARERAAAALARRDQARAESSGFGSSPSNNSSSNAAEEEKRRRMEILRKKKAELMEKKRAAEAAAATASNELYQQLPTRKF